MSAMKPELLAKVGKFLTPRSSSKYQKLDNTQITQEQKAYLQACANDINKFCHHQNDIQRTLGIGLPKSIKILAWKIAEEFQIKKTERSLALIIYYLISYSNDKDNSESLYKAITQLKQPPKEDSQEFINLLQNINIKESNTQDKHIYFSPQKAIKVLPLAFNSLFHSKDVKNVYSIIKKILQSNDDTPNHFKKMINATEIQDVYSNTLYSKYKNNTLFNREEVEYPGNEYYGMFNKKQVSPVTAVVINNPCKYNYHEYFLSFVSCIENLTGIRELDYNLYDIELYIEDEEYDNISQQWKTIDLSEINKSTNLNADENNFLNILFPAHEGRKITADEIRKFYKNHRKALTITYKVDGQKKEYVIKPVYIKNPITNQEYVHFECGFKSAFAKTPKLLNFHFIGNMSNTASGLENAGSFSRNIPDSIQIICEYPSKGINAILNPSVTNWKLSIEGSIAPHIAAYNYYSKQYDKFDLQLFNYSYGNFAVTYFENRISKHYEGKILTINSTPANNLPKATEQVAILDTLPKYNRYLPILNPGISKIARNMVPQINVFEYLNKETVYSLNINSSLDIKIYPKAQLNEENIKKENRKNTIFLRDFILTKEGIPDKDSDHHIMPFGEKILVSLESVQQFTDLNKVPYTEKTEVDSIVEGKQLVIIDFDEYIKHAYKQLSEQAYPERSDFIIQKNANVDVKKQSLSTTPSTSSPQSNSEPSSPKALNDRLSIIATMYYKLHELNEDKKKEIYNNCCSNIENENKITKLGDIEAKTLLKDIIAGITEIPDDKIPYFNFDAKNWQVYGPDSNHEYQFIFTIDKSNDETLNYTHGTSTQKTSLNKIIVNVKVVDNKYSRSFTKKLIPTKIQIE